MTHPKWICSLFDRANNTNSFANHLCKWRWISSPPRRRGELFRNGRKRADWAWNNRRPIWWVATYRRRRWSTTVGTTRPCLSRTKCHRRRIRRRLGNTFQGTRPIISANRSPLRQSEKEINNTTDELITIKILPTFIPILTTNTPRTHIPIANGTVTLGKFGSAIGMWWRIVGAVGWNESVE